MMAYPADAKISKADRKEMEKREQEWQAESDLNTLIAAAKICMDPERHKRVMAKKRAMLAELENIKAEY